MLQGLLTRYYSEDDGQPQGGDAKPSDVLERYGRDALKLAEKLSEVQADNYKIRDERRELKRRLADLEGKIPGADAVVLSAADAAAIEAYRALGDVDGIKAALAERESYAQQLAQHARTEALRAAAAVTAYDADVLATLAGALPLTVKEVADGKDKKPVAYITDADGKEHRLADYAAAHWAKFMPALAPKAIGGDAVGSPAGGKKPLTPGEAPRARLTF